MTKEKALQLKEMVSNDINEGKTIFLYYKKNIVGYIMTENFLGDNLLITIEVRPCLEDYEANLIIKQLIGCNYIGIARIRFDQYDI